MFSFSNPPATPQQQQQQPQQQQPQSSTPFGGSGFGNSFSSPGGFSFGNNSTNAAQPQQQQQQQPQQQQPQQGTPQSGGLFGQKPMFGTPGAQQPTQQQQPSGSLFGNTGTPASNSTQPNLFGTPQNTNLFGSSTSSGFPQQSQSQNFGQQTSTQSNAFGQGALGFNSSSPAPFSAQPQTQPFSSPMHHHNATQQHGLPHFGTPQSSQQQQQHQQQFQHQQHQQALIEQQRLNLEQQSHNMSYIPGYLSRTKVVKPYKLPSRQTEPTSPEAVQDADSSIAFGTHASKSGKEESTPSSKGHPSPVGRFSSSFFNERRDDASFSRAGSAAPGTPWRGGKESIFGAGGLRGGRQSATPAPASANTGLSGTPARKTSTESPARSIRSNSTPPAASAAFNVASGAMDEEEDDDAPPQERLEDETSTAAHSSLLGTSSTSGGMYSANYRSPAAADATSPQKLLPTRNNLSASSATALQRTSPSLTPAATSSSEGYASTPTGDASAEKNSTLGLAQRTVLVFGYPTWMEKAVLELFASIGGVELMEAIDLTGSGSAQEQASAQPSAPALSCCTRVRYTESFQALHALRRNGEVVAGACMVGVRWEDDNFHQVALTNGSDAVFRMDVFPSSRTAETYKASSKSIAVPSIDAAAGASALSSSKIGGSNAPSFGNGKASSSSNIRHSIAFGQGASERANSSGQAASASGSTPSYPAFGRPLSVIDDPSVAFKPSVSGNHLSGLAGSPFKAASSLFGSGAAGAPKAAPAGSTNAADPKAGASNGSTSVLGRITEGIFGW